MKQLLTGLVILYLLTDKVLAQQTTQAFGQIDTADLRLTDCNFEKGANAMILFDKADVETSIDSVVVWRHKRIKLFNDNARELASVRLPFYSYRHMEDISSIEAQTIRLEGNVIVITKLDPKLIYTEIIDKNAKALVFAFPDVKPGCVIEYRYKFKTRSPVNVPTWVFQTKVPTRFSGIDINMAPNLNYNIIKHGNQPFIINIDEAIVEKKSRQIGRRCYLAKSNISSFIEEPYGPPGVANYQTLTFQLHSMTKNNGVYQQAPDDTWLKVAMYLLDDEDFGKQLNQNLSKADVLLKQAQLLKTDNEKIDYLYNEVKKTIKWNNINNWYTNDGVHKAWNKKTGNSTEVNLILYNLLKKAGIEVTLMVVSTREHGAINRDYASFSFINKTVLCIPLGGANYYILDATNKYNVYNQVPADLLNTYGIQIARSRYGRPDYRVILLTNEKPALQNVIISGEIKPDSRVTGNVSTASYNYQRAARQELYDKLGLDKYTELLRGEDNHLKISDLIFENMAEDSLPLIQKFNFYLQLNSADGQYIYFNPNLFTPIKDNPFLSEKRLSDIDFVSRNYYLSTARYKLPEGYKTDVIPENIVLNMFDKSITFRRVVVDSKDGFIELSYSIFFKRSQFDVDEYPALRDFYKKMYEMLNEPIVLKKGA